ncbi:serine hydrolase domain-containing protein [Flagellimonas zhangzhouensis]|uniref:CubicO group peptidase, beta-lactamase class C family n=1 Tax=Flagellimonas zhangzhouensis TaxID=1073328 RepID=A0A1H2ULL3_9FLAO|nr:serine hydrolase domain-containing protein [Allomuricauda zhangzhouensis]SDQ16037.1 CubicO group peptidase, beta-lactamase class C family [Allomuricauda zhangzhouensis]SDW56848.1 CubicO group peptidase, beta-lactamase class C family [Allomuricauda zhangzhouensis]
MNIKRELRTLLFLTLIAFNLQTFVYGQSLESLIDEKINDSFEESGPGAVFLVAKEGEILYKNAFGMANLELQVPMRTANVFEIGSMTKQFTAISILMLMEEDKLNLDDEITQYIPDYPTLGYKITIHHLLTHTSGIKSFTSVKGLNEIATKDMEPMELIDFFKKEPMDFAPGEQFKYNNSGYVLLGYIIEKVSGMSYADYVEQHIFKKLGMNSSRYASHSKLIINRASGYHKRDGYINSRQISYSLPYASGSLMSTVEDLLKWNEAIKNHTLINAASTQKIFTNYKLNNGNPINYGYGWHITSENDVKGYEHGGSIFGFKSMGVYLPEQDIYVIGLSNCDCNSPTQVTREIAHLVLADQVSSN